MIPFSRPNNILKKNKQAVTGGPMDSCIKAKSEHFGSIARVATGTRISARATAKSLQRHKNKRRAQSEVTIENVYYFHSIYST